MNFSITPRDTTSQTLCSGARAEDEVTPLSAGICCPWSPFNDSSGTKEEFLQDFSQGLDKDIIKVIYDFIPYKLVQLKSLVNSKEGVTDKQAVEEYFEFLNCLALLLHWLQAHRPAYGCGSTITAAVLEEIISLLANGLAYCEKLFTEAYDWIRASQVPATQLQPLETSLPLGGPMLQPTPPAPKTPSSCASLYPCWKSLGPLAIAGVAYAIPQAIAVPLPFKKITVVLSAVASAMGCLWAALRFTRQVRHINATLASPAAGVWVAVAGSPTFWPARLGATTTTATGVMGYQVHWLEEVGSGAADGGQCYRLGNSQVVPAKSIFAEGFLVYQLEDGLFQIPKDVIGALQHRFDTVMKAVAPSPPVTAAQDATSLQKEMPAKGPSTKAITTKSTVDPQAELQALVRQGAKRNLLLHMIRLYHLVLVSCYTNRARIFGSGMGGYEAGSYAENFAFYT